MVKQNGKPKKKPMGRPNLAGRASPGARSPIVGLRFPPAELAAIDKLADREGLKRSEMVRQLIAIGMQSKMRREA